MKKILFNKISLIFALLISATALFSGCAMNAVSYHITNFPNKIIYEIGEKPNYAGLKIETTNSDGTNTMVGLDGAEISKVDTSTSGEKKVFVKKGSFSTAFNIYVASVVVNDSDNLKEKFQSLVDGDVVYLKAGNYVPKSSSDESYKDIVINKSVTIIGDGRRATKIYGNFIVGANLNSGNYETMQNAKDVKIFNIGFKLYYSIKNGLVNYAGPYGKTDKNGAINAFDTKNLSIKNCSFDGYAYGILGNNLNGLTIENNSFRNILKNAIKTTKDTRNASIYKNVFMDIAKNIISSDNNSQSSLGAIELAFAQKGNAGVIVCKNTFTRIGLCDGGFVFYDEASKTFSEQTREKLKTSSYINNTAIITLLSSAENDLEVSGIILSTNNYGQALTNIRLNTTANNTIDQNGVIVTEAY